MADVKVTKMVMKVDLQCSKCYRKIKQVLCRYPQIRSQEYDEKKNTVKITVVCCSPEKIKEKIARKAGNTVESIEIIPDKQPPPQRIIPDKQPPPQTIIPDKQPSQPPPPPDPVPMHFVCACCWCYQGRPCYHGRGLMCYDGCGRPAFECSGGNSGYYVNRCYEYFSEENASGCIVM